MDLIYDVQKEGINKLLILETSPDVLSLVLTNPWTKEEKTLIITTEGENGERILVFTGVSNPGYEDLPSGLIYFDDIGTWEGRLTGGSLDIRIRLQVI